MDDLDDLDVEVLDDELDVEVLDDELLGTPGKDLPASASAPAAPVAKANPLTSLPPLRKPQQLAPLPAIGGAKPLAAPRALAPVRGGSGASAPTAAALAARAKAEASQAEAAPARVSGSLMGTGGDTSSSDEDSDDDDGDGDGDDDIVAKTSTDRSTDATRPTRPMHERKEDPVPTNVPVLDAFGDDGGFDAEAAEFVARDVSNSRATSRPPRSFASSGDAAIDAIDALDTAAEASASHIASKMGVRRLAEKYEDKFELELDDEEEKKMAAGLAESSAAAEGAGDDDDEFLYAFEGEARSGATHRVEFKARPMPTALVTNVKSMPMETFAEEEEEEEEEASGVSEAEDAEDADARARPAGDGFAREEGSHAAGDEEPDEWDAANAERDAESSRSAAGDCSTPVGSSARAEGDEPATAVRQKKARVAPSLPLSYSAARAYFAEDEIEPDLRLSLEVEETPAHSGGCCGFLLAMVAGSKPAKVSASLVDERYAVFAAAKTALDDSDATHVHLLNATYMRFLGTSTPPARVGAHWERLGFQGSDPATDLRGCGMLGLLQLFCLVAGDGGFDAEIASTIFALSRDSTYEFPMAPLGINVTKAALKALRLGHLNATANSLGSVWDALDRFYVGAWIEFFVRWRDGKCTMARSGFVTKEWEAFVTSAKGAKRALELADAGIPPEPPAAKPADEAEGEEEEEEEPEFTSF